MFTCHKKVELGIGFTDHKRVVLDIGLRFHHTPACDNRSFLFWQSS